MCSKNAFQNEKINILIISDRLMEYSKSLYVLFNSYEDITCNLIHSVSEFNSSEMGIPDFLLTAGYLEDDNNYKIIERVRELNSGVFCILLGRVDSCIKFYSQQYSYNEYFDRNAANEKILERLQTIRQQIRNGFEFREISMFKNILWCNNKFTINAYDTNIMSLRDFGIMPAGLSNIYPNNICYIPSFCIENNVLKLMDLTIESESAILPELNGVKPKRKKENMRTVSYVYNSLHITLPYSGEMIVVDGPCDIVKNKTCKLNKLFGWNKVVFMLFRNGQLIMSDDRKDVVRYIRRQKYLIKIKNLKKILKKDPKLTPLQKDILLDCSGIHNDNKKEVYKLYMKYFDNYKLRRKHI